jgi:hypothetical protein
MKIIFTFLFSIYILFGYSQTPSSIKGSTITCSDPVISLTYTASLFNPSFGGSLVWSILPNNNFTLFNAHDTIVQAYPHPGAVGTYTIYCKIYDMFQVQLATLSHTVIVLETPHVIISGATIFCKGSSINLTATSAIQPSTTVVYNWTPSSGLNTTNGSSVLASPITQTTYTVNTTTGFCNSTKQITVYPFDSLNVTFLGINTFCQGSSTSLQATTNIQSGSQLVTYSWSPSYGLNTTTGSVVISNPASPTVYTLTANAGSCVSQHQFTIAPFEMLNIDFSGNPTFCNNSSTEIRVNSAFQGNPLIVYDWLPVSGLNTAFGPTVTAAPNISTTYTVTSTLNGNCSNNGTITIAPNYFNTPTISVSQTSDSLCEFDFVTITAIGANTYTWTGNTGASFQNGIPFQVLQSQTYYVIGTDTNLCISNTDSAKIYLDDLAIFNVTSTSNNLPLGGGTATLTITNSHPSINYYMNGVLTTTTIVISPTVTTNYVFYAVNPSGCNHTVYYTQSVGFISVDNQEVDELQKDYFDVYPNPTNGTFTVNLNTKGKQSLQAFDMTGNVVLSQTIENGKTTIDASHLAAGIYNISIKGTSSITNKKLVIVK